MTVHALQSTFHTVNSVSGCLKPGAIWHVPKHELIFWMGHKNCWGGGPGVFTWYHTRIGSMNFNFRGLFGGHPGAPKSKIKIRAHFVLLPKNPQQSNILNIALTIKQLNLKFKFGWGHKNSWGRRNYLGAMTQARHCVTLRWPLSQATILACIGSAWSHHDCQLHGLLGTALHGADEWQRITGAHRTNNVIEVPNMTPNDNRERKSHRWGAVA